MRENYRNAVNVLIVAVIVVVFYYLGGWDWMLENRRVFSGMGIPLYYLYKWAQKRGATEK